MTDSNASVFNAGAIFEWGVEHLRNLSHLDTMTINVRLASLFVEIEAEFHATILETGTDKPLHTLGDAAVPV